MFELDYFILYSVRIIVSTTSKLYKQLVLSYYMCPAMLLFPLRIMNSSSSSSSVLMKC